MSNLHAKIMNIQVSAEMVRAIAGQNLIAHYKLGHRDARHAAAELASSDPLTSAAPEMLEALRPFAAFLDAAELMSGPSRLRDDDDTVLNVTSGQVGQRIVTYGDLKAARAAIAKAEGNQ